jgi:hypothetical protein
MGTGYCEYLSTPSVLFATLVFKLSQSTTVSQLTRAEGILLCLSELVGTVLRAARLPLQQNKANSVGLLGGRSSRTDSGSDAIAEWNEP